MSLLICKFASPRSKPEKIQRWIAYLDRVQERALPDASQLELVHQLRSEARSWLVKQ
jgi:hypothetical protein